MPHVPFARAMILLGLGLMSAGALAQAIQGPARLPVRLFALLPEDFKHPESLAADPLTGTIYVASFDAREPESARNNQVLRLSSDGTVLARRALGATPVTGLAFSDGYLYFLNFGQSRLQRLPAGFDAGSKVEEVASFGALDPASPGTRQVDNPDGSKDAIQYGSSGFPAVNGMVFDRAGNLYVSDSFQGALYRIPNATNCRPCHVEVVLHDPLLATTAQLPFGANGLALGEDEGTLYINNAGDGRILALNLADGALKIFAEGVHGADGLLLEDGLLWVSANQDDTVIAIDGDGREYARAGGFLGIRADGSPDGLLFPAASIALGRRMVVANLALPITDRAGDEWEESVSRWNLMTFDLPDVGSGIHKVGQTK